MGFKTKFLPMHEDQAEKERDAIVDLLMLINEHTKNGHVKLAKDRTTDLFRSLEELHDLAQIKEQAYE